MFNGIRLKEIRISNHMTQGELGKAINVTKVSICCYEKGTRTPSLDTLNDLSIVFGVDANFFLNKDIFIKEDTTEYGLYISKEEQEFINELRKNKKLHNLILENPKRSVELIDKKLK